jgi:signal transduction histidine kinase
MTTSRSGISVQHVRARLSPQRVDEVLAALLLAGGQVQVWLGGDASLAPRAGAAVVVAAVTGSLALRRRFPAAVGIGVQALLVLAQLLSLPLNPTGPPATAVPWFCALYALAVWTTGRRFRAGLVFFAVSDLLPGLVHLHVSSNIATFTLVAVISMLLARRVVGDRDRRLRLAERERELTAREAVVEERARIARELHDAIAHNVSMMVVQAGAERRIVDPEATSTRETLQTIEQIGRGALTEMRRLVGMLRSGAPDPLAPQPGLRDLATLAGQVREAGLPVELRVEGDPRELPVGIELSAYRIVQEALTNALKHAGDARAEVRLRYAADAFEVEVVDDGGGDGTGHVGGHGLAGMRERVAVFGGEFAAGRRDGGGFEVRARLPLGAT